MTEPFVRSFFPSPKENSIRLAMGIAGKKYQDFFKLQPLLKEPPVSQGLSPNARPSLLFYVEDVSKDNIGIILTKDPNQCLGYFRLDELLKLINKDIQFFLIPPGLGNAKAFSLEFDNACTTLSAYSFTKKRHYMLPLQRIEEKEKLAYTEKFLTKKN